MRKSIILVFAAVFLTVQVSATTIGNEEIDIDLGTEEVQVDMHVVELTSSNLTYLATHRVNNLQASSNNTNITCNAESSSIESQISCNTGKKTDFNVRFTYTSPDITSQDNGDRVFEYTKDYVLPTENFSLSVTLPHGEVLIDQSNITRPVYSPVTGETSTDGQRITVSWHEDPELGDSTSFRIFYHPSENQQPRPDYIIFSIAILAAIGLITLGVLGYRRLNKISIDEVYDDLNKDEKRVLELLKENEGSLLQKELVKQMDYSKAKVSDIVSGLVEKEILKKEKEGRSNSLSITKDYTY